MLHLFAAVAVPVAFREADVVQSDRLVVFAGLEVTLAVISLTGYGASRRGRDATFGHLTIVETFGSAVSFGALAWYGSEVVSSTPSKHLLMITLLAVTSVTGLRSSMVEQRRSASLWGVALLGASHFAAYAARGELLFAALTVLWCSTLAYFVRRTHEAFRWLTERRLVSEHTARHDDLPSCSIALRSWRGCRSPRVLVSRARCSYSTSTASRRSTTDSGTPAVTPCSRPSPTA